jgi:hypothetical protein
MEQRIKISENEGHNPIKFNYKWKPTSLLFAETMI